MAGLVPALNACARDDAAARQLSTEGFEGVSATPLDAALFEFNAVMTGSRADDDTVAAYARCGAAGYALSRGFPFLRHVRTKVDEQGGVWTADAVYTISPGLPRGVATIDAEVTAADCGEQGIPTV